LSEGSWVHFSAAPDEGRGSCQCQCQLGASCYRSLNLFPANPLIPKGIRRNFVPEGQHDRSLARSAWESVHRSICAPSNMKGRVTGKNANCFRSHFASTCLRSPRNPGQSSYARNSKEQCRIVFQPVSVAGGQLRVFRIVRSGQNDRLEAYPTLLSGASSVLCKPF
jgi:hypothetical protein